MGDCKANNVGEKLFLGHDKMIFCLATAHAFILTHRVRPLVTSVPEVFFCIIRKFLPAKILTLEIHSFKQLRYTYECNN